MVFPLLPPQFRPSSPCLVLLRHVASLSESFTKAVSARTCAFLSLLLLLAGDVEVNPGPRKGKGKAVAGQQLWSQSGHCDVYTTVRLWSEVVVL